MDDDIRTAVDDCGLTQVFGHGPPPPPTSVGGSGPVNFEYGRQQGNWTAGQTVFGSGIDYGYQSAFQQPHASSNAGASTAGVAKVQPLSADALKKLRRATEEEEKRRAAVNAREVAEAEARERVVAAAVTERAKAESVAKAMSKGFYVPKQGGKGIRIVSKDGKSEVIVRPQTKMSSAKQGSDAKLEAAKDSAPMPAPASVKEAPPKAEAKAPSAVSRASSCHSKRVRIVGKNGEEAFIELPFAQSTDRAASHAYVPAVRKVDEAKASANTAAKEAGRTDNSKAQQEEKVAQAAKALRLERKKQEKQAEKAAQAAKALRLEREQQEKQQKEERERQANAVANAVMSGGLGGSRKSSPAGNAASIHTVRSRSRSPSVVNGIFDTNSKAPSKASSRTMTPPPAQAASMRAASKASSHHSKPVPIAGWQTAGPNTDGRERQASGGGWPTASDGTQDVPSFHAPSFHAPSFHAASTHSASQHRSQRSKASSPPDWEELGSGVKQPPRPPLSAAGSWQGVSAIYKTPSAARQPSVPAQPPPPPQRRKASTPPSRPDRISQTPDSRGIPGWNNWNAGTTQNPISLGSSLPSTRLPSHPSAARAPPPALNTHLANTSTNHDHDPTIFAGTGWISPHPLSVAPAEFEEPPQDQISLCGGGKMTFAEWQRLREEGEMDPQGPSPGDVGVGPDVGLGTGQGVGVSDGRNNWSRTSSGAGSFRGGGWAGERPAGQDWTTGQTWEAGQGHDTWGAGAGRRVPTIVSEHSRRSHVPGLQGTVRSGRSQRSAAPSLPQSFRNSSVAEMGWGIPQVDGAGGSGYDGGLGSVQEEGDGSGWREPGRAGTGFGSRHGAEAQGQEPGHGTWREPARSESPVLFRTVEGSNRGERVQLRMPWDH